MKQQQQQVPQSWKEALDRHCRQHVCLQASLSQLLQPPTRGEYSNDNNDDDEFEVPWALPTPSEIVMPHEYSKLDVALVRTDPSTSSLLSSSSSTSTPRKIFNAAKSIVGGIYATVKHYTTEEEDDYWHEPESELDYPSTDETTRMVSLDQPMVHVSLTHECLSALMEHAASVSSSSDPWAYRRSPWTLVAQSDWVSFARRATGPLFSPPVWGLSSSTTTRPPLSHPMLSLHDIQWLLEVLVANRHVRLLARSGTGKPDVIVFSTTTAAGVNKDTKNHISTLETEQDSALLQTPLALFDLQHSMKQIQEQIDEWTHQGQVCSHKALSYKQQKQPKLAISQLARRKLLQEHMESHARTLLQLERVYHSIDMAQSNQILVSLLAESANLLHQLSSASPSIQDIDEIQDSMHDALERIDDMHMALTTTTTTVGGGGPTSWDDDDLLAELASLTINDDDEDPKKGTTRREPDKDNDEDQPVGSESPAIHETRSDAQTTITTDTASHRTPLVNDTTTVVVPSS